MDCKKKVSDNNKQCKDISAYQSKNNLINTNGFYNLSTYHYHLSAMSYKFQESIKINTQVIMQVSNLCLIIE